MFADDCQIQIAVTTAAGATATSAITSAAIDTLGFGCCTFLVPLGPITTGAVTSLKVQQSSDDAVADDYSDVVGSSQTIADDDDNKLKYVDVCRPGKRYLKLLISRGTQAATIGSVLAILSNPRHRPVAQGTNVAGESLGTGPAEGTA